MSYKSLSVLEKENRECLRCALGSRDAPVVTSSGSPAEGLMVVSDFATAEDDLMALPFSGRAGDYTRKLLQKVWLDPYITLLVKCHGAYPNKHIKDCQGWLLEEIRLAKPQVILTLGKASTDALLKPKGRQPLKDIVGQLFSTPRFDAWVAPWYHPAQLLRQGKAADDDTIRFFSSIKKWIDTYDETSVPYSPLVG